ncbi:MAG: hypothetical protein WCA89_07550 [Terracidiphilus sp.]
MLITLLFCIAGLAGCGHFGSHHPDYARDNLKLSPLKAEIALARETVINDEIFFVNTTLRNTGSNVWDLGGGCGFLNQWTSDSPSILVIGEACFSEKNIHNMEVRLKPGETYERAVPVRVHLAADGDQHESVTFRLRFNDPTFNLHPEVPPVWSNAVTVNVTR